MTRGLGRLFACGLLAGLLASAARADDRGQAVELGGLKSTAPASWKMGKPSSSMRAYQATLPRAEGDKADAELVVFYFGPGGGGSVEDNLKRWKGMLLPAEGKTIDDAAKVEKMKVAGHDLTYLDVQGTYLHKDQPFNPNAAVEKRPDYRMLAVIFEAPQGPYYVRVVGPAKTVAAHKKGFDAWLKNFK